MVNSSQQEAKTASKIHLTVNHKDLWLLFKTSHQKEISTNVK